MADRPANSNMSVANFEFDLATPFFEQLLGLFESLETSPLTEERIRLLTPHQGIYGLYQNEKLVYVGKADNSLPGRLEDHQIKISGRLQISVEEIEFKGVYLAKTWVPLAPETKIIAHFQRQNLCEWNGGGFGQHDPGRNREETNKPPYGFDSQFPIKTDWPCIGVESGAYEANDLLQKVKGLLPFCFRYETDNPQGAWRRGSTKYAGKTIEVSESAMPAARLIALIARQLGSTWQATKFPSHIILYEEQKSYKYGEILL